MLYRFSSSTSGFGLIFSRNVRLRKISPGVLYPLSFMRAVRNLPVLSYDKVEPMDMPDPYRSLLVHEGDMASRLERIMKARLKSADVPQATEDYIIAKSCFKPNPTTSRLNTGLSRLTSMPFQRSSRSLGFGGTTTFGWDSQRSPDTLFELASSFIKVVPDGPIVEAFGTVKRIIFSEEVTWFRLQW